MLSIPPDTKPSILPERLRLIGDHSVGNFWSLVIAAAAGGLFAFLVGIPLMRLSGLAAGIATFAVLEITQNILGNWERIGPGAADALDRPADDRPLAGDGRRDRRVRRRFCLPAHPARPEATRDARGSVRRAGGRDRRTPAAALGVHALWGAGRVRRRALVHLQSAINTDIYLDFTFLTLAMLVVGGSRSLWGAVVGALVISGLFSFLSDAETGSISWLHLRAGWSSVAVAAFMAGVLLFLPRGLTGGREFAIPRAPRPGGRSGAAPERTAPRPQE